VNDQRVMSGFCKQAARGPVAVSALGLAGDEQADLPYGSLAAGQAFEVIAGPRETPLMTLFKSIRAKVG